MAGSLSKAPVLCLLMVFGVFEFSKGQVTSNPPQPTKVIESFKVNTDIRYRFATTQMVSCVRNTAEEAQDIAFDVTLPKEAFITNFSMSIDGKEYAGEVKEKNAAKRQYQAAVDKGQSAGHVRQAPRHSNVFEVFVNVANGSAVTFTLTYQELLKRKNGIYEHEIHVSPGQAVEDFQIEISIMENKDITFVKTPALRKDVLLSNEVEENNNLAVIERRSSKTAYVKYSPTLQQQGDGGLSARFAIQYDVDHSANGEVLVVDGYFLHVYAPDLPPLPKDIIFILDVSGSMSGNKIKQLKTSMMTILKTLRPEDQFNILSFSNDVTKWRNNLVKAESQVLQEAISFVNTMRADGGTNINEALLKGLAEVHGRERTQRVGMIFFLTDGQASSGIKNSNQILSNVRNANNEENTAIFSLAFGSGADFNLLKKISNQNSGFARKIYFASDSALQVASLYEEISTVVLKDVRINYLPGITKTTKTIFPTVFNGTEIFIGGCIDLRFVNGKNPFANVTGVKASGDLEITIDDDDIVTDYTITDDDNGWMNKKYDYSKIVEKMWAFLTIKQMLKDKERVIQDEPKAEELKAEILALSLKYNFVTPLTSMVVTKPGDDEKEEKVESRLEDADNIQNRRNLPVSSHIMYSHRSRSSQQYPLAGLPGLAPSRGFSSGSSLLVLGSQNSAPGRKYSKSKRRRQKSGRKNSRHQHSSGHSYDDPSGSLPSVLHDLKLISTDKPIILTTMSTPTTSTSARRIKPGRNRKLRAMLSTLVIRSPQSSVCANPRRMSKGVYTLLHAPKDQLNVEYKAICKGKRCRKTLPDSITFTYKGQVAKVQLSSLSVWRYSQSKNITVQLIGGNKLEIMSPIANVIITKTTFKRKLFYDIEVILKTQNSFKGLLGKLLARPKKMKRMKKVPKHCLNKQANISVNLKRKFIQRFIKV